MTEGVDCSVLAVELFRSIITVIFSNNLYILKTAAVMESGECRALVEEAKTFHLLPDRRKLLTFGYN